MLVKSFKESMKIPLKDRPKITKEDAGLGSQNKETCQIYYLKIFNGYFKWSLSGVDRICYNTTSYSIEGNI